MIAVIISVGGFRVTDLHGLFGMHALPEAMQYFVTLLFVTAVINAYNLIDGGWTSPAGSRCTSAVFAVLFYFAHDAFFARSSVIHRIPDRISAIQF